MYSTTVIAENKWYAWGNPHLGLEIPVRYRANLLNEDGSQCCLGFESEQCGIHRDDLLSIGLPHQLSDNSGDILELIPHLLKDLYPVISDTTKSLSSRFADQAININDDRDMAYEVKKKALVNLWAKHGWKLIFVLTVAEMNRKIKRLKAKGE